MPPITITGSAGTRYLINTRGLHRGYPPRRADRLMCQAIFGLTTESQVTDVAPRPAQQVRRAAYRRGCSVPPSTMSPGCSSSTREPAFALRRIRGGGGAQPCPVSRTLARGVGEAVHCRRGTDPRRGAGWPGDQRRPGEWPPLSRRRGPPRAGPGVTVPRRPGPHRLFRPGALQPVSGLGSASRRFNGLAGGRRRRRHPRTHAGGGRGLPVRVRRRAGGASAPAARRDAGTAAGTGRAGGRSTLSCPGGSRLVRPGGGRGSPRRGDPLGPGGIAGNHPAGARTHPARRRQHLHRRQPVFPPLPVLGPDPVAGSA